MTEFAPLLAYIGPEVTLPLASFLAVVLGFLFACWHYVWGLVKNIALYPFRGTWGTPPAAPAANPADTPAR
jgi:hypothetical protein